MRHIGLIVIGTFLTVGGCLTRSPRDPEVVLAAVLGERPFTDSIVLVSLEGASRTLLAPTRQRSYTGVSAVSMRQPIAVQVNSLSSDAVTQSLMEYNPETKRIRPSCWDVATTKGMGAISPKSDTYAFPNFASEHAGITFVRCNQTGGTPNVSQFIDPETSGNRAWYISLAWFADASRLAAVKVWRGGDFRGIRTELQLIDVGTKKRQIVLGREDAVVACAVAKDGRVSVLDGRGVEILSPDSGERRIVLPTQRLDGRRYLSGGITWLNLSNDIVVGLVAPTETIGELWKISARDGSAKVLDRRKGFRFASICSAEVQPK